MKKISVLVIMLFSMFQMSYASEPWYFNTMGINDNIKRLTNKKTPVVVSVVDSGVAFVGGLSDTEYAKYSYTKDGSPYPVKTYGEAYYIHGTAMASVISSRNNIYGIYPFSEIASRRVVPDPLQDSWQSAVSAANLIDTSPGIEKIINVSGGNKGLDSASSWSDLLSRIGKNNKNIIVAAVGNDGADIRKLDPSLRIWPAAYHPASKINKKNDPVIRVAALAQYKKGEVPVLHGGGITGSRYGSDWVDIAAPGQNINYLTPYNTVSVGSGTSEATAIVSGVLAAMASCNPRVTAQELKKTLLDTADTYTSLTDKVTGGKVLNAEKAIKSFCLKNYIQKGMHGSHAEL